MGLRCHASIAGGSGRCRFGAEGSHHREFRRSRDQGRPSGKCQRHWNGREGPIKSRIRDAKLVQKTYVRATPQDSFSHEAASEQERSSENDFDAPLNKLAKLLHADGAISDKELKAAVRTSPISQGSNSSDGDARRDGPTKSSTYMRPVQAAWRIVKSSFDWRGRRRS